MIHLNGPAELLTGWSQAEALGHALNEKLGQTACPQQTTSALVPSMGSGAHEDTPRADTAILVRRDGAELNVDFGVGYSSFSYLRKFPLDALKVDRSFTNDISRNPDNAMILSALINIGKSLEHRVVAEGVETEEQLHFLQQEGCSEGQGYFFGRPVIAEKLAQFLQRGVTESMVH